jgi:hypothetical protein
MTALIRPAASGDTANGDAANGGSLDLVNEIRRLLRESDEPLTAAKIRDRLPAPLNQISLDSLAEVLKRQAAAHVLIVCPKYRSQQDRYWDRPLREHVHEMLRDILTMGPLPWSELRKRLPRYARYLAESVLNEQLAQGRLFRHPPRTPRSAPRFALYPADLRTYLRPALADLMARLEPMGFARTEIRRGLKQILSEAEDGFPAPQPTTPRFLFAGVDTPDALEAPMFRDL